MVEEKIINARSAKSKERKWRIKLNQKSAEAKNEGSLFCETCANLDHNDGATKAWYKYTEGFKLIKERTQTLKSKSGHEYSRIQDFICPSGHGYSRCITLNKEEKEQLDEASSKKRRRLLKLPPLGVENEKKEEK